jgi:hypothetical protein
MAAWGQQVQAPTRIKHDAAQAATRQLVRTRQPCQPTADDCSDWVFRKGPLE